MCSNACGRFFLKLIAEMQLSTTSVVAARAKVHEDVCALEELLMQMASQQAKRLFSPVSLCISHHTIAILTSNDLLDAVNLQQKVMPAL